MDRWAAEIGGYSISITEEALENESMSLSEALVLAYLFSLKNGAQLSEMKKTVLHLNGHDYDEFDEAVPHDLCCPSVHHASPSGSCFGQAIDTMTEGEYHSLRMAS